jgi:nucleoside-diphosphate-sugar epimerase
MRHGHRIERVLLTGASGFIGARLAQCLTQAYDVEVHALVHRLGTVGTARLARLSRVRLFAGDVRDAKTVSHALEGCTHVVHCAIGTAGSSRERGQVTIEGTRVVLQAAHGMRVERVVHLSTASVHDPARCGQVIREDAPLNGGGQAQAKVLAERVAEAYSRRNALPLVILRPTCVWGPWSPVWTAGAAELIRRGVPFLPRAGRGTCNAVYVDNLVDAVWLALQKPEVSGQCLLVNDDEPTTWGELYGGYAECLQTELVLSEGHKGWTRLLSVSLINAGTIFKTALQREPKPVRVSLRTIYDHVPLVKLLLSLCPEMVQVRLTQWAHDWFANGGAPKSPSMGNSPFVPYVYLPGPTRELYAAASRYSNEKAKTLLGWKPRVSFKTALAGTCEWLAAMDHQVADED